MNTAPTEGKYQPQSPIQLLDRQWPSRIITQPPQWCEVGLRDGNQSLENPMLPDEKLRYFQELVRMGFKQIEVGFPSASQEDFDFCRQLIEGNHLPEDVSIQVLVQCREELIRRTCAAIQGAPSAIIHFYNSTDPTQRELTFRKSKEEIRDLAVRGAQLVKRHTRSFSKDMRLTMEYSPESFSDTEMDYALEVCGSVMEVIEPSVDHPMILNLPQTVQRSMPNHLADQIEYFIKNLRQRASAIISLHNHNDCGTGVAATELGLLAGADRVEGVLFGNGERAGNANLTTLIGNMYSRGMDPGIDLGDLERTREIYEQTTGMKVPDREPYAGRLVFTAFSGSHQDSIKKGMDAMRENPTDARWRVHYLHVDPTDLGRDYEPVRINGQSGKGGAAFILKQKFGIEVPKAFQPAVYALVQSEAETSGKEVLPERIHQLFTQKFMGNEFCSLLDYNLSASPEGASFKGTVNIQGEKKEIEGTGNGPINAFINALGSANLKNFELKEYEEGRDLRSEGSSADAYSFVKLAFEENGEIWGCGNDENTSEANYKAILAAMNQYYRELKN